MTNEVLGEMFAEALADNERISKETAEAYESVNSQRKEIMDSIAAAFSKKRNPPPQYSPEVKDIADALQLQPMLIPLVDAFLKKAKVKIESAIQTAMNELQNETP